MKMFLVVFISLLCSFSLLAQQEEANPAATPQPTRAVVVSNLPVAPMVQPFVPESGAFFDTTLNTFLATLRTNHYAIPAVSRGFDLTDGSRRLFFGAIPLYRFEWLVGSQSNRIRSVTLTANNLDGRNNIDAWFSLCNAALSAFYPSLTSIDRLSMIGRAMMDGQSTYQQATLTFVSNNVLTIAITNNE